MLLKRRPTICFQKNQESCLKESTRSFAAGEVRKGPEEIILAYLSVNAKNVKPSSYYSMLKAVIIFEEKMDINRCSEQAVIRLQVQEVKDSYGAAARRQKVTRERDNRIPIMNDIIFRMREIKTCELTHVKKLNRISNDNITIATYIHKLSVYVFILVLTATGTPLEPHLIFMSINVYNLLKTSVHQVTFAVNLISEVKVCITRIEIFLLSDHEAIDKQKIEEMQGCKIYARNLTAQWNSSQKATIKDVNFKLDCGQLVAVTGDTGSGKSSLFQTILQELFIVDGILSQDGLISYASQNPWVFSATIRENIIFNEAFNQNNSHGDKTLVGEKGAMLSGGQKARINLARAIYKGADIYLLDNPQAAMDVCVVRHIFTQLYVLEDGKVKFSGKYETLEQTPNNVQENRNKTVTKFCGKSCKAQIETKEHAGSNKVNTYTTYLFANESQFFVYLQFFLFISTRIFMNGSDVFLCFWINLRQNPTKFSITLLQYISDVKCVYIYSGFILIVVFLFHMGSLNFVECCNKCSLKLHDTLFNKILYGTIKFFDSDPSGRIVNRISSDISAIDETIPKNVYQVARQICTVLGIYVVVNAVNHYMIAPTLVLLVIFYYYLQAFRPVLNKLKRIAATRKLVAKIGTTSSIDFIFLEFQKPKNTLCQNSNAIKIPIPRLHALHASYAFWTDFTCMLYVAVVIFFLIIFKKSDMVGNVGLSITQSLLMISAIQYMIKIYGELETQMTSVEIVAEYDDLTVEDNNKSEINPPAAWPASHM
ncbi:probable multidrug resistance-associated protein lethal(2)03659 [Zophobas morio]|uniref:probable multidrug resistance-associated protein lethal(2)03659 n=1 Tax=Zophobas morio TaxID=2755281 RepID=UPI003082921D